MSLGGREVGGPVEVHEAMDLGVEFVLSGKTQRTVHTISGNNISRTYMDALEKIRYRSGTSFSNLFFESAAEVEDCGLLRLVAHGSYGTA